MYIFWQLGNRREKQIHIIILEICRENVDQKKKSIHFNFHWRNQYQPIKYSKLAFKIVFIGILLAQITMNIKETALDFITKIVYIQVIYECPLLVGLKPQGVVAMYCIYHTSKRTSFDSKYLYDWLRTYTCISRSLTVECPELYCRTLIAEDKSHFKTI